MPEILLCNHSLNPNTLKQQCGINIDEISSMQCKNPKMVAAKTPYLISREQTVFDRNILGQFSSLPVSKELTNLSLSYGEDNVIAMSEIISKLKDYNIGMMGATTSVYANRLGGFAKSVQTYQKTLMDYREAIENKSPSKTVIKMKAQSAFNKMQSQFRHELKIVTQKHNARRGTSLTSANRGLNIAKSRRNVAKLNISSKIQANNLVKLTKQAKFLGNGLAIIDFGSRIGKVSNSYHSGRKWERELFIESSSFALSATAGVIAVEVGSAALSFLVVATPIGWIGLIIGGLAVAGAATAASISVDNIVKSNSGGLYDSLMKHI